MNVRKCIIFIFGLIISLKVNAQNKVCESSDDKLIDMNTIGKCAIEKFKKSDNKKTLAVSTRNRYVRKKSNSRYTNLRTNLNSKSNSVAKKSAVTSLKIETVSVAEVGSNATSEKTITDFIRYDKVTKRPELLNCANFSDRYDDKCKNESLVNYLNDNLIYPFDAAAAEIEGRVWVRFIVDKEGYAKNISTSGPENGELLKKEVERLIKLLPKFIPGKYNDDYVNVEYFVPVDFELDK